MKKKILFIAVIMIIVGIVIGIIALSTIGFDLRKLATGGSYVSNTYNTTTLINSIKIDEENSASIRIVETSNTYCTISYEENEKEKYEIIEKDGVLIINGNNEYRWYDYIFNIYTESKVLTVEVPKTFIGEIEADGNNGKIEVNDVDTTKLDLDTSNGAIIVKNATSGNMELETSNGMISLENIEAQDVNFKTSNGAIKVKDVLISDLEAYTSNGLIDLESVDATGYIKTTTSNGRIQYETVTANSVESKTNNGVIKLYNVDSNTSINAKTSNQGIELSRVSFKTEIRCQSSNGKITGTIVGKLSDFRFDCHTSNGECNLPQSLGDGSKTVYIHTSNGNISVNFTE